ncbi:MAG TPA: hypothetical protein VLF93_03320 [Candidatus Saccharimonadales bacterium]|nr:hypothetical protein [Candidatus Saccharimonadales bacterium]
MKRISIFVVSLLVGFLVVVGFAYATREQHIIAASNVSNSPLTTKFSLVDAPSNSLKGKIASMSGSVLWLSRTARKPVQLHSSQAIQQGEEITTGENSSVSIVIKNTDEFMLSGNTHVNFIQMLPINLVVAQNKGSVLYENTGDNALTVNALDLIATINRAWVAISVDPDAGTVTIDVQKGATTIGYEDSQNTSQVVQVTAGKEFVFDDTTRTGSSE